MRDISHKSSTLRFGSAQAVVKLPNDIIELVKKNETYPKKDILAIAKAAGFLAVKNTPSVIPHCHPIPVEDVDVEYEFEDAAIRIVLSAKTIYRTGIEVEAMHGVSVVALTVYDMLKPMTESIEIGEIKVLEKKGGKSQYHKPVPKQLKVAILVMSDSIYEGKKSDKSGLIVKERMTEYGLEIADYKIIPDELEEIRSTVKNYAENKIDLILTSGGTGLSPRDLTPEAIRPLFDKEIASIMDVSRSYGQERTPYAMLSRGTAGLIGKSLVLMLPGSSNGVKESLDAIFPHIFHIFKVQKVQYKHEDFKS